MHIQKMTDQHEQPFRSIDELAARQQQADTISALKTTQTVPSGWKLVPLKHTLDMSVAFAETWYTKRRCIDDDDMQDAWSAMIDAAPQPPAPQEPTAHLPCCGYADTSALRWNPYNSVAQCHNCGQVYAAPQPARQPLTEDEIKAAAGLLIESSLNGWMVAFARKVEAAHGIIGDQ